jgi:integrase/recombinase XerD
MILVTWQHFGLIGSSVAASLDIHDFDGQFRRAWRNMESSALTERNKTLIRSYRDACVTRHVCGRVWLRHAIVVMTVFGLQLAKDFDTATRDDLEALVVSLHRRAPPYRPETISTYKRILRRFMCYVRAPDTFPRLDQIPADIAWINTGLSRAERAVVRRSDLFTPDDIVRILAASASNRDRALIAVLWESGARIGEVGNLRIRDVTRAPIGFTLDVTGKTGTRTPLLVSSAPELLRWLRSHPTRTSPSAPLWIGHSGAQMPYWTIAKMLRVAVERAGIAKPARPHLFRHSRVTYVLANGIMNEQQAKLYFGWVADSRVLGSTYAHLVSGDANVAILLENGFSPARDCRETLRPHRCASCGDLNAPTVEDCEWCGAG